VAKTRVVNGYGAADITRVKGRCTADEDLASDHNGLALLVLLVLAEELALLEQAGFVADA